MNNISIDSHKVEANDSVVNGSNNLVFGNNNRIVGDCNKIYGNNNIIVGNDNVVKGVGNVVEGGVNNEVSDPFAPQAFGQSSAFNQPQTTSPVDNPRPTSPANIANPPSSTSPPPMMAAAYSAFSSSPTMHHMQEQQQFRPVSPVNNSAYFQPAQPVQAFEDSYSAFSSSPTMHHMQEQQQFRPVSPVNNSAYFQPGQPVQAFEEHAQQQYAQQFAPVMPQHQSYMLSNGMYPTSTSPTPMRPTSTSPVPSSFQVYSSRPAEKELDIIKDGTLVFMITEWESDYIREFCTLVSLSSGQKVGWHVSCGRTCVVALGDLEAVREAIIETLPQLNYRLCEWSYNSFGKKVCPDRELYEKRLFKQYTKEDVDCWRNNKETVA